MVALKVFRNEAMMASGWNFKLGFYRETPAKHGTSEGWREHVVATFVQVLLGLARCGPDAIPVEDLQNDLAAERRELNVTLWKLEKKGLVQRRGSGGAREFALSPDGEAYLRERGHAISIGGSGNSEPTTVGPGPEPSEKIGSGGKLPETAKLMAQESEYRRLLNFLVWLDKHLEGGPVANDGQLHLDTLRRAVLEYLGVDPKALARELQAIHDLIGL